MGIEGVKIQGVIQMNFLHYIVQIQSGEAVQVSLDKQANVRIMDSLNFNNYKQGRRHSFLGGLVKKSPIYLQPPYPGQWHLVVDLGGYSGTVRASVETIKM